MAAFENPAAPGAHEHFVYALHRAGAAHRLAPRAALRYEVDLPAATAAWVVGAHVLVVLSPLALMRSVYARRAYLEEGGGADYPFLLLAGCACAVAGSAFEMAQNTFERWHVSLPPAAVPLRV